MTASAKTVPVDDAQAIAQIDTDLKEIHDRIPYMAARGAAYRGLPMEKELRRALGNLLLRKSKMYSDHLEYVRIHPYVTETQPWAVEVITDVLLEFGLGRLRPEADEDDQ